jgi:hypothetical protein
MKQRLDERWAHFVGRQALRQRLFPWIFVVFAIIWVFVGIQQLLFSHELEIAFGMHSPIPVSVAASAWPFISSGVLYFCIGQIWFERRSFYRIIEQQRARISELEAQRATTREPQ